MQLIVGDVGDIFQKENGDCYYIIDHAGIASLVKLYKKGSSRGIHDIMYSNMIQFDRHIGRRKKKMDRSIHGFQLSRKDLQDFGWSDS